MKIQDLIEFINNRVPYTYYPNRLPTTSVDRCASVKFTGGFPTDQWTGKRQPSFQILVRGENSSDGSVQVEDKAYEVYRALTNLREVKIGEDAIVVIRSMNSYPLFIGEDENNRPLYSLNFDMVVRPRIRTGN